MSPPATNSRHTAVLLLVEVIEHRASLSDLLPLQHSPLAAADQALVSELTYGVCRWYHRLERMLARLLKKPLRQRDADVKMLLMVGIYQLLYTRVPPHAAINETVQLTRAMGKNWATGMVNAILRRVSREMADLESVLSGDPGFQFSHPDWLLASIRQDYPDHWQDICAANNARAPLTLRVNQLKTDRESYLKRLRDAGINARAGLLSDQAIILERACPVEDLPDFALGHCSVQDEAAQLTAGLLQTPPAARVLDACAAPGGKTCHLLEQQPGIGELVALDISEPRCKRIEENLSRLGLTATIIAADAQEASRWWDGEPFDRILLDAPCSATGVIRRHPDIKLLRQPEDIAKLGDQQLALLSSLWPLLSPGGLMLYATCSILSDENDGVAGRFVQNQRDAIHRTIRADWGLVGKWGRQLLPAEDGNDGFYYALIEKRMG